MLPTNEVLTRRTKMEIKSLGCDKINGNHILLVEDWSDGVNPYVESQANWTKWEKNGKQRDRNRITS